MAVAYSGGLDSTVLLRLTAEYAAKRTISLFAFHVHHGLSPNANAWLAHCRRQAEAMGASFDFRKVVIPVDGTGPEAAARSARYQALGEMCRVRRVPLLLTAHHLDDQAETVLLQMLRGAGLGGMSGMDSAGSMPTLMGDTETVVGRPLLPFTRDQLAAFANAATLSHVEDESNRSLRHPRNALRHQVLPMLEAHFPAYRECLSRSAQHAQAAQRLLNELAAQDLAENGDGDGIHIGRLVRLSEERATNLLRHWLTLNGLRPPSAAWLSEARSQLFDARADAQVCIVVDGAELRRHQGRILITRARQRPPVAEPVVFRWEGEPLLAFPGFGGTLYFDRAAGGADPAWLRDQTLRIQYRAGGGKLKISAERPSKILKDWYQEKGIPPWERQTLPLVYAGQSLWFAAGLGQDCRCPQAADGVRLRWQPDT